MPNTKPSSTHTVPASFSKRVVAVIYDAILMAALLLIATAIASVVAQFVTGDMAISQGHPLMVIWLLCVGFLYYGVSWKVSGQTLGLRTWRLRLIMEDGAPLNWHAATLRYAIGLVLFLSVIGFVWMLFNSKKQTLYDKLSRTKVVDEKKSGISPEL